MVAMELQMSIIMLVMLLRASQTFLICDSSNIPAALSTSKVFTDQAAIAIDALRQASVPMTLDTAIAIGISEIFAGVAAGAATRGTADFLGDKKKDTFRTKVSTTGAFFGARSLAVGLARYCDTSTFDDAFHLLWDVIPIFQTDILIQTQFIN